MRIFGINHRLKACAPFETMKNEFKTKRHAPSCLPECEFVGYDANIRVNKFDAPYNTAPYNGSAVLVLHYETFSYGIITEYHESLGDFLCKALFIFE